MEEKLASSSNCRPTISFPLGMILLVITLLLITAFFFCCVYWNRLRALLFSSSSSSIQHHDNNNTTSNNVSQSDIPHEKPARPHHMTEKQSDQAKSVTVVMPGDDVPKFIGMACPCEPLVTEKITVVVHKPFN